MNGKGKTPGPRVYLDSIKDEEELDEALEIFDDFEAEVEPSFDLVPAEHFHGRYSPNIDHYLKGTGVQLTPEDRTEIASGMKKKATGLLAAIPMNCSGDACPFNSECPFFKVNKAPVGFPCPVESMVMDLYTKRYLDEYGVVVDSFSETTTMTMLAATHVMEMRAWKTLSAAENASGIISNVVGFNEEEEPIVQQQEHPAFNILERAWKWRDKLLVSLVGTRREKYKRESMLKEKSGDSSLAKRAADLKSKIDKLAAAKD